MHSQIDPYSSYSSYFSSSLCMMYALCRTQTYSQNLYPTKSFQFYHTDAISTMTQNKCREEEKQPTNKQTNK